MCAGTGPNFYDVTSISAEGQQVKARRRFDDLVQLHEDLKRRFRGCVIPFRPGKTKTNSTLIMNHGESFLKERAFGVKCYLNKIVQHPDMKRCEVTLCLPPYDSLLVNYAVSTLVHSEWRIL